MSIDRNDPRLTAYALGELEDAAAFEAELANDPAARAEVEAIRKLAGQVRDELRAESAPALTTSQRAAVQSATKPRRLLWLFPAAAAAALLVSALLLWREAPSITVETHAKVDSALQVPSVTREEGAAVYLRGVEDDERSGHRERKDDRSAIGLGTGAGGSPKAEGKRQDETAAGLHGPQDRKRRQAAGKRPNSRDPADAEPPPPPPSDPGIRSGAKRQQKPGAPTTPGSSMATGGEASGPVAHGGPVGGVPARDHRDGYMRAGRRGSEVDHRRPGQGFNTEGYDRIRDNPFRLTVDEDTSTFSIDVDTASYSNVRRFLKSGRLPPKDAVRIEELINYFDYDYAPPKPAARHPFRTHVELGTCPWQPKHRLARIALKGKVMDAAERPPSNLVFLIDVSGSMQPSNKLPLLQQSLQMLVRRLGENDRVALVVYAGAAGLVLPSTPCTEKEKIEAAIGRLRAGGSTNGGAGIQLAYAIAAKNFIKGGVNRVILATDGDFNVGVSDRGSLTRMIEQKAKGGVFLTVLGFGMGNYKDDRMEELSNKGNGNYAYIDTLAEAKKVLVDQLSGTLVTIAKDVKIQIFFNPKRVASWRLIGYANRLLAKEDFNDDTKDAGEIGAGHAVTALYELVLQGEESSAPKVDENPFVRAKHTTELAESGALLQLRLRYKQPDEDESTLMEEMVRDDERRFENTSREFQFATAVASFGMLLRDSEHKGVMAWDAVEEIARSAKGPDENGLRAEFVELVRMAKKLATR